MLLGYILFTVNWCCILAIICPAPKPGINTVEIPDVVLDGLFHLESYTYSCIDGFVTNDDLCTVCLQDGMLSLDKAPLCEGKYNTSC